MTVARNIETAMTERGLNAASLARLAGINYTGIYDILSGKSRSPKIETVQKVARALNLPVSMLFEERLALKLRNELLEVAAQLPPQEQQRLLSAAKAWLAEGEKREPSAKAQRLE